MPQRPSPTMLRLACGLLALLAACAVVYLMPHRIHRRLPIVHGHLFTYAKWGRITREELFSAEGHLMELREFNTQFVPLYRIRISPRLNADRTCYFKDPAKPHWSECITSIDQQTVVVQTDSDQDGIVDLCECSKPEWGM